MPRNPLLTRLLGAFRTIRGAKAAGLPVDEYAEVEAAARARRREQGLTRRGFLGATAAVAAIPLLPSLSSCGGSGGGGNGKSTSVAIVGAGIAGLHCAYRLSKLGMKPQVYDAGTRVGGRMFTDRTTFPDGQHCELGGELIDTGHATMRDLATELGIELYDYAQDDTTIDHQVAWFAGRRMTSQEILTGFTPIAAKIDAALATLTDQDDLFVYYNKHNGGDALDAMSITAWLDSISATGDVRKLLELSYTTEYGLEPDVSNVLNMLLLISTDTAKFEIYGDSDENFHTKTGNDTYPTKLAAALDPTAITMGATLMAIAKTSGGRYTLTFAKDAGTVTTTVEHVVLALPFTKLREVDVQFAWPAVKQRAIMELGYGTNAKLMAGFSSKPWRTAGHSTGETFTDLPFQTTWETSRLQPGASGIITNFTGGARGVAAGGGTPESQLATFLGDWEMVFPGSMAASNGKVARMHWPTAPLVKGSYAAYKVGQYGAFAGAEIERVDNIHFCGEHTSLDAQGYMEGGALTGAMAADELAADVGLSMKTSPLSRQAWMTPVHESLRAASRVMARARAARELRRWQLVFAKAA